MKPTASGSMSSSRGTLKRGSRGRRTVASTTKRGTRRSIWNSSSRKRTFKSRCRTLSSSLNHQYHCNSISSSSQWSSIIRSRDLVMSSLLLLLVPKNLSYSNISSINRTYLASIGINKITIRSIRKIFGAPASSRHPYQRRRTTRKDPPRRSPKRDSGALISIMKILGALSSAHFQLCYTKQPLILHIYQLWALIKIWKVYLYSIFIHCGSVPVLKSRFNL